MHDITELEGRGVPAVFVATTEFKEAAEAQATALGFDPAVVYVPHPIQNRTDEEIQAIADDALDAILNSICTGG